MKTKEELCALKNEVETLNRKLAELSEDELKQVTGGAPALPATMLAASVFSCMFVPCEPPVPGGALPATIITPSESDINFEQPAPHENLF